MGSEEAKEMYLKALEAGDSAGKMVSASEFTRQLFEGMRRTLDSLDGFLDITDVIKKPGSSIRRTKAEIAMGEIEQARKDLEKALGVYQEVIWGALRTTEGYYYREKEKYEEEAKRLDP